MENDINPIQILTQQHGEDVLSDINTVGKKNLPLCWLLELLGCHVFPDELSQTFQIPLHGTSL